MKNTHICPKCDSKDILRLTDNSYSNMIPTNFTVLGAVHTTRFLCANCGYIEEWVEDERDREDLRKRHRPA